MKEPHFIKRENETSNLIVKCEYADDHASSLHLLIAILLFHPDQSSRANSVLYELTQQPYLVALHQISQHSYATRFNDTQIL